MGGDQFDHDCRPRVASDFHTDKEVRECLSVVSWMCFRDLIAAKSVWKIVTSFTALRSDRLKYGARYRSS